MTNNTIFDDVFRTMVEKMTYLVVPLINEVFHTAYPEDVKIVQLRNEHQLEDIMYDFINGDIDVLVSTTIIETGLDIPNVNTMIIQDAQLFRTIFEKRKKDTGFSGGRVNPSGFSDVCISGSNCESGALYKR